MNFLRIGNQAINLDLVTHVTWTDKTVNLFFGNTIPKEFMVGSTPQAEGVLWLEGKEADAVRKYFTSTFDDYLRS